MTKRKQQQQQQHGGIRFNTFKKIVICPFPENLNYRTEEKVRSVGMVTKIWTNV